MSTKVPEWNLQMTPKNLDRLMLGKYGRRTINSLTESFANNMGVVTDIYDLAELVKELYWDNWSKSYDALNKSYDIISPYKITKNVTQSDNRDISETGSVTGCVTGTNTVSTTGTNKTTGTTSQTATGSVTGTDKDTNTVNATIKDEGNTRLSGSDSHSSSKTDNSTLDIWLQ